MCMYGTYGIKYIPVCVYTYTWDTELFKYNYYYSYPIWFSTIRVFIDVPRFNREILYAKYKSSW